MNTLYQFIKSIASIKNVIIGLILIMLFNTFFLPFLPRIFWGYHLPVDKVLDLKIAYNSLTVYNILDFLGFEGRRAYKYATLFIDTPYAVIYSITYPIIIYMLLKANNVLKYKYLIVIPVFIGLSDLIENLSIVTLLNNYPEKMDFMVKISSMATSLKWIFAVLTFVIILLNILKYSYGKIKNN